MNKKICFARISQISWQKWLTVANTLAHYGVELITAAKSFMV